MLKSIRHELRRLLRRHAHPLWQIARRLRDDITHPRVIEPHATDRVLVLAPHMDDEAIGCGGSVLRHRQHGNPLVVVYLTDGAEGDARLANPATTAAQADALRHALRAERPIEALAWCAAAGAEASHFLGLPDGRLGARTSGAAVQQLADIIAAWRPTVIYLPSPLEIHPDHRATNVLAMNALALIASQRLAVDARLRLRGYEVWTPVLANAVMDITRVVDAKARLLGLHASQLRDIDYTRHTLAINAYRAMLLPGHAGHAEAFIDLTAGAYAVLLSD